MSLINTSDCNGNGLKYEQNFSNAFKCYEKLSILGNSNGFYNLGCCNKKGQGVEQNNIEVLKC